MSGERRGTAARLGISALNIAMPGLGLLRTGDGRLAAILLAAPWLALGLILLRYAAGPQLDFTTYAIVVLSALASVLGSLVAAIVLSWRRSAVRAAPAHWWSRWYGILGVWLVLIIPVQPVVDFMHGFYKPFYIPAESMMPTLAKNDRLLASMRGGGRLRRGDVVLVRVPGGEAIYVKRVAGLPGDRIAMNAGTVIIDGQRAPQRHLRVDRVEGPFGPGEARRFAERFPGEAREHEIHDTGPTPMDEFPETRIPPGHIFVLGDNRDHSADSRVAREQSGLELVPVENVVGRPLFFTWRAGRGISGEPIAD